MSGVPVKVVSGRYELSRPVGRGGTATVWEAIDRVDGARVAFKWLRGVRSRGARRAWREVAVLRTLQLPGVAALRDEGVVGGRVFVVTDWVDGARFPGAKVPCAWGDVEGPLVTLLDALGRVHAAGVVHLDLKPENVLVREGRAVLIDFGLARASADAAETLSQGTLAYMAPEALHGREDHRSDLYSVGVMLYRSLTGHFPFRTRGGVEAVLAARAVPLRLSWHGAEAVPEAVRALCARLLAPSPHDRPDSAGEVLRALRGTREGGASWRSSLRGDASRARTEDELRACFTGPGLLTHVPEDAARVLHALTGGDPLRVERTLVFWVRAGLARRVDDKVSVRREDLARLMADPGVSRPHRPIHAALSPVAHELFDWLALAGVAMSSTSMARAMGVPVSRVRGAARELLGAGLLRRDARGALSVTDGHARPPNWPERRRKEAHARIAQVLLPGAQERLRHVFAGELDSDEVAREVCVCATGHAMRGRLDQAERQLEDASRFLVQRAPGAARPLVRVFGLWAHVALEQRHVRGWDRLLRAIEGVSARSRELDALERVTRAALATLQWTPNALDLLGRLARFEDAGHALLACEVRVVAAQRASPEELQAELTRLARRPVRHREWPRWFASWRGRLDYTVGRYAEAARRFMRAVRGERWVVRRARMLLNAAAAWMESFELARALACAVEVEGMARALRLASIEGRAVWLRRTIGWRLGQDETPQPEWVGAAREVDPELTRLMAFHEATLAWHRRETAQFTELASCARASQGQATEPRTLSMLDAMAVDLGLRGVTDAEREATLATLTQDERVPDIALQYAALTRGGRALDDAAVQQMRALAGAVPEAGWNLRRDLLSVRECLARLGISPPVQVTPL